MEDLDPHHNSKTNLNNNQVVSVASNDLPNATDDQSEQQPTLAVVLVTTEDTDKTAKGNDSPNKRRRTFESVNGNDNFKKSKFGKDYFDTLPPGLRFCPYDTELITDYLAPKVFGRPLPQSRIFNVKLYKHNPEYLAERYREFGEREWYFFTPRYRKYRNGDRPNRAAGDGYWKATGADKPVKTKGNITIGSRKALVFYRGKAPLGKKTNWIMHEFRVSDPPDYKKIDNNTIVYDDTDDEDEENDPDMGLDNWVLCRIYKKSDKRVKSRIDDNDNDNDNPTPAPSPDDDHHHHHHQQYDDQQGNDHNLMNNVIVYEKHDGFSSLPTTTPPPPVMYVNSVAPPGGHNIVLPPHINSSNNYLIPVVEPMVIDSLYPGPGPGPDHNDDIFGWNYNSFFGLDNQLDQQVLHFSGNDESFSGYACQPTQPRQEHH